MKSLKGSTFPTALVVCVLISLLVLLAIMLFDQDTLLYSVYHNTKQQKEDIHSAFILYYNDSTLLNLSNEKDGYQLYEDRTSSTVHLQAHPWGLYECVTVSIAGNKLSSTRLVGKAQECSYQAALWVCSRDIVLSFAGSTEIKGKVFIPINGINYIQLQDTPFTGEEIGDNCIDLAERELPSVDSLHIESVNELKEWKEIRDFPSKEEIKPYYSFKEPPAHFYFPERTSPSFIRGNVVLHADEATVSSESMLSDIIVVARKVIVEEGFCGSLQIIASDTVILKDYVQLQYPSGIYLNGNVGKTHLSLGAHSQLSGYAVIFGETENNSGVYVENSYHQDSTATFRGLLYVDGTADIRGKLSGAIYLKECCYLPENGLYEGTINDARIYRNNKIAYPFLLKESIYKRREIKTVYE